LQPEPEAAPDRQGVLDAGEWKDGRRLVDDPVNQPLVRTPPRVTARTRVPTVARSQPARALRCSWGQTIRTVNFPASRSAGSKLEVAVLAAMDGVSSHRMNRLAVVIALPNSLSM
jgi:hypothetical protein